MEKKINTTLNKNFMAMKNETKVIFHIFYIQSLYKQNIYIYC